MYNTVERKTYFDSPRYRSIENYVRANGCTVNPEMSTTQTGEHVAVIIPACNEEHLINSTLTSLQSTTEPCSAVVVVNGSTDSTEEKVKAWKNVPTRGSVECLTSELKGPGFARKRGMDQVVTQYLFHNPQTNTPYYMALLDADTPDIDLRWIEAIRDTFEKTGAAAVAGVYGYPLWIDQMLSSRTGMKGIFEGTAQASFFLTSNGAALIQTTGVNTAIEIGDYVEIGGSKQPLDANGKLKKGSDRLLGHDLRAAGKQVAFLPIINRTSSRRALESIIQGVDPAFTYDAGWQDCRGADQALLSLAMDKLTNEQWLKERTIREYYMTYGNITLPILQGIHPIDGLLNVLGSSHQMIRDLQSALHSTMSEELLDEAAKQISREHSHQLVSIALYYSGNEDMILD